MSHQLTFADSEFSSKRRQTRKEIFLSRMEQILPWQNMVEVIEPFYPKAGNGRRPYPLETMLRIHCMQHWYNLSDGAMEDALYEIASMRLFARLSLDSALPDRTTIMNFRHLLEQHQLARQLFKTINRWLAEAGVMMTQGTLVDATIIEAPSSTKNKEQQRDPQMHQTKKGNQLRIPVKLNSDSGICEHHFRKVCGQGFFEQKLSFEGRHLFDSLNKPAAKRSAAVVDPRRWNRTVHLTSEYVH